MTPGQKDEFAQAPKLLAGYRPKAVLADKGYDSDAVVTRIRRQRALPVIPPRKHRRVQREYDARLYRERNRIERMFNRLKNFRRVATRYDKLDCTFLGFIHLAAIYLWLQ